MTKLYFAPLEGITGYIYRNAYFDIFEKNGTERKIDKYFSPFISPGVNQVLSKKELKDILPENNKGCYLVPQLLGNRAEDILLAIQVLSDLGYREINLNLGCPSGTVVAKKKGAGLLADTELLKRFLDGIFAKAGSQNDIFLSVKTRIGKDEPEEFMKILALYNQYPMEELIIHPRVQKDFYKNVPNEEMFAYAIGHSKNALCYNGDIANVAAYAHIEETFPSVERVMIGRGFIRNPMLAEEITGGSNFGRDRLIRFCDRLLFDYVQEMSGERPVLFKMKELWSYMGDLFLDADRELKRLRKAESLRRYKEAAEEILRNKQIRK